MLTIYLTIFMLTNLIVSEVHHCACVTMEFIPELNPNTQTFQYNLYKLQMEKINYDETSGKTTYNWSTEKHRIYEDVLKDSQIVLTRANKVKGPFFKNDLFQNVNVEVLKDFIWRSEITAEANKQKDDKLQFLKNDTCSALLEQEDTSLKSLLDPREPRKHFGFTAFCYESPDDRYNYVVITESEKKENGKNLVHFHFVDVADSHLIIQYEFGRLSSEMIQSYRNLEPSSVNIFLRSLSFDGANNYKPELLEVLQLVAAGKLKIPYMEHGIFLNHPESLDRHRLIV